MQGRLVLILSMGLVVGLLATGYWFFLQSWVDPQPVGEVTVKTVPGEHTFSRATPDVQWETAPSASVTAEEPFDVRLMTRFVAGAVDSAAGLALSTAVEDQEDQPLLVWVTPTGYAGLSLGETWLVPLAPWPHVRRGMDAPNEIWVTRDASGQVTIRLNREIFWQGETPFLTGGSGVAGRVWAQNRAVATYDFEDLSIWQESTR